MNKELSGTALTDYLESLEYETYCAVKAELLAYLRGDRMCNYGYDWTSWRRIQGQRQRVKARLKRYGVSVLRHVANESRLSYTPGSGWQYTVGQSQNEEITNLIARLCDYPARGWLS